MDAMLELSLNSWSLHRHLGPQRFTYWNEDTQQHAVHVDPQPELTTLLELPAALAAGGFRAVEICHFHFPSTEGSYLDALRVACRNADIRFHTLLLDYGDIASADECRKAADLQLAREWIDTAARAGAERIRIVAGEAPPHDREALARSIDGLLSLAAYGEKAGVRVLTENFRPLASTADNCVRIVEAGQGAIGLTADFGNLARAVRFEALSELLPHCESVHAKPDLDKQGLPDEDEFRRNLGLLRTCGYEGPITLVYDGPGDMWAGIERVRTIAQHFL